MKKTGASRSGAPKPVVQRPRADNDIDDVFHWLARESPTAALAFLDSLQAAYALLGTHPAIGSTRHSLVCPELPHPLRYFRLKDFPRLLIYYMERADAVEVIRVWDAARGLDALMDDTEE